jgi:hypothetical protein
MLNFLNIIIIIIIIIISHVSIIQLGGGHLSTILLPSFTSPTQ